MSRKWKALILSGASLVVVACATSAILISRASTKSSLTAGQGLAQVQPTRRTKNLSLQPEAARVNRRLGNRFKLSGRAESTLSGNLSLGGNQQPVTIIRRQTEDGEIVELLLPGRRLTWNDAEGIKAISGQATEAERLLAERLIFDSPDQFVLAQLRGASYFTMAQNVRSDNAIDGQTSPGWTQVRVNEPEVDQNPRLTSRWRIYYINSTTGLIDRIVSELNGKTVEARILRWIEDNGQKFPAHITWLADGEIVLDYQLNTVSQLIGQ